MSTTTPNVPVQQQSHQTVDEDLIIHRGNPMGEWVICSMEPENNLDLLEQLTKGKGYTE